jgi:hypothetical protein
MQSQSLILILFILIIAPILIISSNHNLFFALVAFAMFIASLRSITKALSGSQDDLSEDDEAEREEFEDMIGLDAQKFGVGAKVVKNLVVILFYIYCLFFIRHTWLKMIDLLLICSLSVNIKEDLTGKIIISVGNEGNGVSEDIYNLSDKKVKVPMPGGAESLNVAIATSVILYEKVRQNS